MARTRTSYRAGEVAELLGVSVDTVRRLGDAGRLPFRATSSGHRLIDGAALARFVEEQAHAVEPAVIVAASARNRLPGIVVRVVKDKVTAQVEIQAGPHRIVSLMTRESADELGLAPGVRAVATVKSTNVVVELPQQR
jgi:molybdopterin-binding protein